jgi:hypothetical protein
MKETYLGISIDSMLPDLSSDYTVPLQGNRNDEYFNRNAPFVGRTRRRLTTGVSF